MTEKILFETKIKNPNRPQESGFLLLMLFGFILILIASMSQSMGFMGFSMLFIFLTILMINKNDAQKDASFQLIQLTPSHYLIKLMGKNLDFELEGDLNYEAWRQPKETSKNAHPYNASNLSIFAPNKEQILIKGGGEHEDHKDKWGLLRGASPYPIGIILEMDKKNIEATKLALEEHEIKSASLSF